MVEGYIDAIAVSEAGFPNVVAPLGTALTPDQCALSVGDGGRADPVLRRRWRRTARGFPRHRDRAAADRRGQEPAFRPSARGTGSRRSHSPERASGDRRASQGRAAARRHAVHARDRSSSGFDTPEQRAALERRLGEAVGKIADETAAPPLPGRHEAAPFGVLRRRTRPAGARLRQRETGLRPKRGAGGSPARTAHGRRGNALGAAKQARPQALACRRARS